MHALDTLEVLNAQACERALQVAQVPHELAWTLSPRDQSEDRQLSIRPVMYIPKPEGGLLVLEL